MIDVAHDGNYRGANDQILGIFGEFHFPSLFIFVADLRSHRAEVARNVFGQLHVDGLVDGREELAVDQLLNDQRGFDTELFGQFLDRDAFGNRDLFALGEQQIRVFLLGVNRAELALFGFLDAALIGALAGVDAAARIHRHRHRRRLQHVGRRRMHGTATARTTRTTGSTRTRTIGRLTRTCRPARSRHARAGAATMTTTLIDRTARSRSARTRPGSTGARTRRALQLFQTVHHVRTRRNDRARGRLSG